jgi:hypothetical protein
MPLTFTAKWAWRAGAHFESEPKKGLAMRANSPCGCSPWHAPWNQPVHKLLGNARTRVLFLHFAADCLDNLKLVWINHFDLGFVRYKGRDTNYRGPGFSGHKVGLITEIQGD